MDEISAINDGEITCNKLVFFRAFGALIYHEYLAKLFLTISSKHGNFYTVKLTLWPPPRFTKSVPRCHLFYLLLYNSDK